MTTDLNLMTLNFFNLLILVGAVHGLLLSLLLFFNKKNQNAAHVLLSLLLLFYTLPVLRVVLHDIGFFRFYDWPIFSIELLYGLGPSLYLYSKAESDPHKRFKKKDLLHFVPVLMELIYYLSPYYANVSGFVIQQPQNRFDALWLIQQFGGIFSVLLYLFLSINLLSGYAKWVKNNYSDTHNRTLSWLQKPIILYSIFFFLWFTLRAVDVIYYHDSMRINIYYPFLILLSLTTYWIGTKGYLRSEIEVVGFAESNKTKLPEYDDSEHIKDFKKLIQTMEAKKPYLHTDLNLAQLADLISINPRLLSKVINSQAKMNFYDFVNQYRIEAFKFNIIKYPDRKILDLAHDSGFNSKTTFNQLFKNKTGLTPTEYKKKFNHSSYY